MTQTVAVRNNPAPALLEVKDATRHFQIKGGWLRGKGATLKAVDGISFNIYPSETLAIVGESGCGKSTLARMIVGLQSLSGGRILVSGKTISELHGRELLAVRKELQLIFQDPYLSLNPRMTVASTLAEPQRIHGLGNPSQRANRVKELIKIVGLASGHAERYPHQFSGGQRQRIGIARALAVQPELIVCDEPVSSLDVSVQAQIINLLHQLQREFGLSYLFVAHDLAVVKHIADRVAVMYLGKIMELADKTELFAKPRHPYTQALLSSVPRSHPNAAFERVILNDDVPSPMNMPEGCRFHTRCPYARERCRTEVPELRGEKHLVACHFWEEIAREQSKRTMSSPVPANLQEESYVAKLTRRFQNPVSDETGMS